MRPLQGTREQTKTDEHQEFQTKRARNFKEFACLIKL